MTFLYTAREVYDQNYDREGMSWMKYIEWSKLTHLIELVSLDEILNGVLVKPDYGNGDDWNYIYVDTSYTTPFYTTLD